MARFPLQFSRSYTFIFFSACKVLTLAVLVSLVTIQVASEQCPSEYKYEPCTCETYGGAKDLYLECSHDDMNEIYRVIDNIPADVPVAKLFISSCPTKQLRPRLFGL